ncbi:MAG: amylosucrase [Pseudomonadota bacterium]
MEKQSALNTGDLKPLWTDFKNAERSALQDTTPKHPSEARHNHPRLEALATQAPHAAQPSAMTTACLTDDQIFALRRTRSAADLWEPLERLYQTHPNWPRLKPQLDALLTEAYAARPTALRQLDLARDLSPDWFLAPDRVGYVFYIDRFAGRIPDVLEHVDYLKSLGVTYVHFMPCLKPRAGESDGGYAVEDYGQIDPRLGTMEEFTRTAAALRSHGIGVCIDMVLNHTAAEHAWARAAQAGDPTHQAFYHMFPDRSAPDAFEATLIEIFPDDAPGSFTLDPASGKWVWTTFHSFQWDLNWSNPAVFLAILRIMLDLLNRGAETLRLDAVAFMWKQVGTTCQNLPPVHDILQALRAATRIVAPGTLLKAEAIVSPADLVPYLGTQHHTGRVCNLAYHNNLMVQFWSSLATRDTRLMRHILATHFPERFENATWGTYLRCHDDIGWAITDEDAEAMGLSAFLHRQFLADFYEGIFPGSFARGGLFQVNEATGDKRNNGTLASLAGLERALEARDPALIDLALQRILMGHALIASFGGIPLIYMGDELGVLNQTVGHNRPGQQTDSRMMQRPVMDWTAAGRRHDRATTEGRLFTGIAGIMARRAAIPALSGRHATTILDPAPPAVFAFRRDCPGAPLIGVFNFSEAPQILSTGWLYDQGMTRGQDLLSDTALPAASPELHLPAYAHLWLA